MIRRAGGSSDILLYLVGLAAFCAVWTAPGLVAQPAPTVPDQSKRQEAANLFQQGKRLEALPLLEDLATAEPKNANVLVALAACLVEHAATLPDQEGGGKERLRARELLDRASELGDRSTLAMNLAQLLKQLPESGAIHFSTDSQVDQAMRAGETAFSRRDFAEALRHYSKALELEPGNYSAALFIGNTYDRQNEFAKAAEWYERAIQMDPNIETAYRYYADMLAKQGDLSKSRAMLIHAAVAEPYNRIVWRELKAWAALNNTHINEVLIGVPVEADAATIWRPYREVRLRWQKGDAFKKRFAEESEYRHSLPEEAEALTAVAEYLQKLESAERLAAGHSVDLLLQLHKAGLIEAYVLFSLGDAGISRDYEGFRAANRSRLEEYLERFVVPPASVQKTR
jgi:Flp pilus assembly protein TadD